MKTREVKALLEAVVSKWPQPEGTPPKLTVADGSLQLTMFEAVGISFVERVFELDDEIHDIPVEVIIEGIAKALKEHVY